MHLPAAATDRVAKNAKVPIYVNYLVIRRVRQAVLCLLILSLCSLSGCCKSFDPPTKWEDAQSRVWVTASWAGPYDWTVLSHWKSVTQPNISEAETLLRTTAVISITGPEAQRLVGEFSPPGGKQTPYLLRAVGDGRGIFPLQLAIRPDGNVWVGGGANSKCPVPMRRQPVVAWLERMPKKEYVTFYVNRD